MEIPPFEGRVPSLVRSDKVSGSSPATAE